MATTKISQLTTVDELKDADKLAITTEVAGEPASRAVTGANLKSSVLAGETDPVFLASPAASLTIEQLGLIDTAIQSETDPLSVHLDQTVPQTMTGAFNLPIVRAGTTTDDGGLTPVQARGIYSVVADATGLYSTGYYSTLNDLYDPSDAGSYADTSSGPYQDQAFEFYIFSYFTATDLTRVYSPWGCYISISDYSSTPFKIQLAWSDNGGSAPTEGYVVSMYDASSGIWSWADVGNINSLEVAANLTNAEQFFPPTVSPYYVASGALPGYASWQIWAYKTTDGVKVYSLVPATTSDSDPNGQGFSSLLSWDDPGEDGADGYIVYNDYLGYWQDVGSTLSVIDDGSVSGWTSGVPTVTPASPYIGNAANFHNGAGIGTIIRSDGQIQSLTPFGTSPMAITSSTLVANLNVDLLDGVEGSGYAKTTTPGVTLPALDSGKFLKSGSSDMSWVTAIEGSRSAPSVTMPTGYKFLTAFTGETTVATPYYAPDGGCNFFTASYSGAHYIGAKLNNAPYIALYIDSTPSGGLVFKDNSNTTLSAIYLGAGTVLFSSYALSGSGTLSFPTATFTDGNIKKIVAGIVGGDIGTTVVGTPTDVGTEKITNGTFTGSATGWTLNSPWIYGSSRAQHNSDGTGTLLQAVASMATPLVYGEIYQITLQISRTAGSITLTCGGATIGTFSASVSSTTTYFFRCSDATLPLTFTPSNDFRGYVDNVTLKKIQSGDMAVAGTIYGSTVSSPADFTLTCPTDKTLVLSETVWDDLPPSPIVGARLGSTAPTLDTFIGGIEQYTFDASNDYVIGATEITHSYKEGTTIMPHIHWATNGSEGSNKAVKWALEWSIATPTGAFTSATTSVVDVTIPAGTPDRTHYVSDLSAAISGVNITIGSYIVWELHRVASAGTAPAANPFALAIGFYVEQDTMGSRTATTK